MSKKWLLPAGLVLFSIVLTIGIDFLEAHFQNTSFYLSESFLFSSIWWLFPPLLYGQFLFKDKKETGILFALLILPLVIHLFAFPGLVWLLSLLFYNHTFWYWQTFQYGVTEFIFILLLTYTLPFLLSVFFKNKLIATSTNPLDQNDSFADTLLVTEGYTHRLIQTKDISYFSANPPYITIHHPTKNYLHNETLKSIVNQLDPHLFVRIHKSHVVNLNHVQGYKSRLNGDYDLTLHDGTLLRLSRNYAQSFKLKYQRTPRVTSSTPRVVLN